MSLKCGIVGLPNVGKSTLFNALTSSQNAEAANYPFCTIDPNIGSVIVPDIRVDKLVEMYNPKKTIPSTFEFVDIAGLVRGASKGEGLGNQFLSHIREVNAIVHIVRCFDDDNIIHVDGKVDPKNDIEIIETELIIKDIESVEKRIERNQKSIKTGDKKIVAENELLEGLKKHLENSRLAKYFTETLNEEDKKIIKGLQLLTDKPVLYVANVDDASSNGNKYSDIVKEIAAREKAEFLILSVQIESEIAQLESREEKTEFLKELGLEESGLDRLIKEGYKLLNLITFFTAGEKEVHSWTIPDGYTAPQAAGVIHTDFEKGFIRAEIMKYTDLISLGSEPAVKEKGLLKIEGKEYIMKDGDIVYFRFNV
ncbi:MAG TPA: redox-regulated ATPase YchF [Bacteroidetes bacterium]|nr:redox-regulated ATPase YchF [Bacteroidota bacterium]HCN36182.1 redox-regulated ATPase YchF [Bacteroidota bacterium]